MLKVNNKDTKTTLVSLLLILSRKKAGWQRFIPIRTKMHLFIFMLFMFPMALF